MSQNYKDTLNLPRTDFPMKANLAAREPEMLRSLGGDATFTRKFRNRAMAESYSFCMTARHSPTAMSTWARRSTKSSRISW